MAEGVRKEKKKPPEHSAEDRERLGAALASARASAGLTLQGAADALQLVKQTISAWEKGRNLPDALMLRRVAQVYGVSVGALMGQARDWPFSMELHAEVSQLDESDLRFIEVAVWSQLKKEVPEGLHYYGDGRQVKPAPKAPDVLHFGNASPAALKKTS